MILFVYQKHIKREFPHQMLRWCGNLKYKSKRFRDVNAIISVYGEVFHHIALEASLQRHSHILCVHRHERLVVEGQSSFKGATFPRVILCMSLMFYFITALISSHTQPFLAIPYTHKR